MSCRSLTSSLTTPPGLASSLGAHSPPGLPSRSRRRHVPFTPRSWPRRHSGHVPRPGPARATWQPPPPAAARLLAHPAPATGPAWTQRIPPGSGAITVRLPWGTGHGKGATPGSGRRGFPKVVPVTPPVALTDIRSRHPVGLRAQPEPVTSRHDARAILSPSALAEHANLANVLEKDRGIGSN